MLHRIDSDNNNNNNITKYARSASTENSKVGREPKSIAGVRRRSSEDSDTNSNRRPALSISALLIYGALSLGILGALVAPYAYKKWDWVRSIGQWEFKASMPRIFRGGSSDQHAEKIKRENTERQNCARTCRLEIVESIPENVTFMASDQVSFGDTNSYDKPFTKSTFEAWKELLELAQEQLYIAAYKSSLRGKHVLSAVKSQSTAWGEEIFQNLLDLKREKRVKIKMVENYPPRDRGDNEDGLSLSRRGVVERRSLHYYGVFRSPGAMHSKFLIADSSHFYLGSANFDWRSLNQKLEIGVLVKDCPCLATDLKSIFDDYWFFATKVNHSVSSDSDERKKMIDKLISDRKKGSAEVTINAKNALEIRYKGAPAHVYLAASPYKINARERTFNLHAILDVINRAQRFIYINVMDYVPMFLYRNPIKYWPIIDDALRRAVVERQVELKMMSAALHYVPQNLHFLKSLKSLNGLTSKGSVQIKILRVPVVTHFHTIIARDRRTHKKFLVTEDSIIIGTSNWVGDYFDSSTGVEIVLRQKGTADSPGPLVQDMRRIFLRDWCSDYSHDLTVYMKTCLQNDPLLNDEQNITVTAFLRTSRMCQPIRT